MIYLRQKYGLKDVHSTFYMTKNCNVSSDLKADKFVYLGPNCLIPPKVSIGKYTMFAQNVSILGGDHNFEDPNIPIIFSGRPNMPSTKIGEDVWIGANSLIMAGITIGNGSIVAAGSIVTKDVESYTIYGGNPAKIIRPRFNEDEISQHKKMLHKENVKINFTNKKK